MAVDSSAWWPGGRTTAKPFWYKSRHMDRSDNVFKVLFVFFFKMLEFTFVLPSAPLPPLWRPARWLSRPPCGLPLTSASHSTQCHCPPAGGSTGLNTTTYNTDTQTDGQRQRQTCKKRDSLTPIPPQGRTAYIFWLIGPETTNQSRGYRSCSV